MNRFSENDTYINELVKACLQNEREAQMKLYGLFAKTMFNTSLRIVKDSMVAEDIVQEAFLKAFTSLSQFRNEVPFWVWLRKIVINKSLDQLRKRKLELIDLEETIQVIDTNTENENQKEINEQMLKTLKDCINQLSDGYRIIFNLYYFEGYDHEEIAQILNISDSTSRSQLTRARQKVIELTKIRNL
jgi:RNA polymerase sigma factor (sigma-70 family)